MPPQKGVDSVELQRLQALVETQRKHIEELKAQLHEVLEVKTQQQLQLVEQSPARRSVKQLLARAAADNTALAKKVEELRAQRNALAVTKAALTAQMSELIRGAADDLQRGRQHKHLLAQIQQLYKLTGQQGAVQPTEQVEAVLQFVEKVSTEQQAMHSDPQQCTGLLAQDNSVADSAAADAPLPPCPTDQQLDNAATSQLIWWDGSRSHVDKAPASATDRRPACSVSATQPVHSPQTSYQTGCSNLTDLSYMSPLKGGSNKEGDTPTSKAPRLTQVDYEEFGSPLSCQSLRQLTGCRSPQSCRGPNSVEAIDESSSSNIQTVTESYNTPVANSGDDDETLSRDQVSSIKGSCASHAPNLLMSPASGLGSAADMSSCNNKFVNPAADTFGWSGQKASLRLEAEFRLAACDSLWPTPAAAAVTAMQGSNCRSSSSSLSHAAWLRQQGSASPQLSRVLTFESSPGRGQSVSRMAPLFDDFEAEDKVVPVKRRGKTIMVALLVVAPLAVAAAAGGAAAWHYRQDEVQQALLVLRKGLQSARRETLKRAVAGGKWWQHAAAATWGRVRKCGHNSAACSTPLDVQTEQQLVGDVRQIEQGGVSGEVVMVR